jgi:parallel beta-helix repeat protein
MKTLSSAKTFLRIFGCIFLFLFASLPAFSQVTGNAFLLGETNHAGIQVAFEKISLVGQSDTTFTDSTGAYSLALQPGVYKVIFEKAGFNPVYYDWGNDQVLSGNDTLADVTLSDLTFKYISGNIKDTLYADTIYIADGNLTVQSGNHLYLEAGTHLLFDGFYKLTVNGNFDAVGTSDEPVRIASNLSGPAAGDWDVIEIYGGTDTLVMEYCLVSHGTDGIRFLSVPFVKMQHNLFFDQIWGLYFAGNTNSLIRENEFTEITTICVYFSFTDPGTQHEISCNYLYDAPATGIQTQASSDFNIYSNTFVNLPGQYGGALDILSNEGDVLIEDNAIINTTAGIKLLVVDSTISSTIIRHNLIYGNNIGIWLRGADGGAVIQNNAIFGNVNYQIAQPYPPGGTPDVVSYNWVRGVEPYYNVNITGLGANIATNANGTPCDAYLNISDSLPLDPTVTLFLPGPNIFTDAGDPAGANDPDGSVADIGIRPDLFCFGSYLGYNTRVFPGDANYSFTADAWDLLPLGQLFGTTGPARPMASNNWTGQLAADWGVQQPNGKDAKHVDCDGDGLISASDTTAILQNYLSIHNGNRLGSTSNGVPLFFSMPMQSANPGDTVVIPIQLGTVDTPAVGMYGMAFSITYDSSMVEPGKVWLEFDGSWLGMAGTNMITLQKDLFADSKIDLAITRIDQQDQNGYGKIADLIIVLDEDISKTLFPMTLGFADVVSQDHTGITIPVSGLPGTMVVDNDTVSTGIGDDIQAGMVVYPNPASDRIHIETEGGNQIGSVELLAFDGRLIRRVAGISTTEYALALSGIAPGMYLLRIQTEKGTVGRKLHVVR